MTPTARLSNIHPEQARQEAVALRERHAARDARALEQLRWGHPRFRNLSAEQIAQSALTMDDAQLVVARRHHFASWDAMLSYIAQMARGDVDVMRYEHAVDALVGGYLDTLHEMLAAYPPLIAQRSTRSHASTLLHYVSANGVEDYRQITPPNILDIARLLLDAGAEVDATSEAYGGGSTTLGLVSTSAHPRARGVQIALIDLLLGYGARIDAPDQLRQLVRWALANGCPEAAMALASRGEEVPTLYAAAGAGHLDRVREFVSGADVVQREHALIVAAQQGHEDVASFLLDLGVSVNAYDGMTPLHNAAAGGYTTLMATLLSRGAKLEAENEFGGTVLSSTVWFALHVTDAEFIARALDRSIDWLLAAGARSDGYPELAAELQQCAERGRRLRGSGFDAESDPTS